MNLKEKKYSEFNLVREMMGTVPTVETPPAPTLSPTPSGRQDG